jgi:hypothetical protein
MYECVSVSMRGLSNAFITLASIWHYYNFIRLEICSERVGFMKSYRRRSVELSTRSTHYTFMCACVRLFLNMFSIELSSVTS